MGVGGIGADCRGYQWGGWDAAKEFDGSCRGIGATGKKVGVLEPRARR